MTAPLAVLIDCSHGHRAPGSRKLRRVVMRLDPGDLARVDALRPLFKVPRAALLRAFTMAGLALAEEQAGAPPAEGGEP